MQYISSNAEAEKCARSSPTSRADICDAAAHSAQKLQKRHTPLRAVFLGSIVLQSSLLLRMSSAFSGSRIAALVALAAVGAALFFYTSEKPQAAGPPDLYSILGVDSDSSTADVKAAYRKLAVKLHPDKTPGCSTCALEFSEVAKAYEVLSEPARRQQ